MRFPPEPDQVHDSGTLVLVKGFTWLPSLRKPGHEKNSSDEAAFFVGQAPDSLLTSDSH